MKKMDVVITLCDDAAEACPWTPPEIKRLHWPIKDPVAATGTFHLIHSSTSPTVLSRFRKGLLE